MVAGPRDDDVLQVRVDGHREVAGQRPRRRGPDQAQHAVEVVALVGEPETDGHRGVLPVAVDVVQARLGVAERRLAAPAVGQDAETPRRRALVPQRLEGPHDRLHVVGVEGLVVVLEVHPARLAGDVLLPLLRVLQHGGAAGVVERRDAELVDLRLVGDAQLLLGLDLGGQAVGVPAEAALDLVPAHGLVARHEVLDVTGQQVAVVRQAVGEGRAVVEDELPGRGARAGLDAGAERVVGAPGLQDRALDVGKLGALCASPAWGASVTSSDTVSPRLKCSSREDDARRGRRCRGTTPLAAHALPCGKNGTTALVRLSRAAPVRF